MPTALSILALSASFLAVVISGITAWRTLFQRGNLRMTPPAIVVFLYEPRNVTGQVKIVLRALLYTTAERGHIVEAMYLKVQRGSVKEVLTSGDTAINQERCWPVEDSGWVKMDWCATITFSRHMTSVTLSFWLVTTKWKST
jgi:hypothetical protein